MELRLGNPTPGDQMRDFDLPSTAGGRLGLDQWVGKPLVLVTMSGRPLALEWEDRHANAILHA